MSSPFQGTETMGNLFYSPVLLASDYLQLELKINVNVFDAKCNTLEISIKLDLHHHLPHDQYPQYKIVSTYPDVTTKKSIKFQGFLI